MGNKEREHLRESAYTKSSTFDKPYRWQGPDGLRCIEGQVKHEFAGSFMCSSFI